MIGSSEETFGPGRAGSGNPRTTEPDQHSPDGIYLPNLRSKAYGLRSHASGGGVLRLRVNCHLSTGGVIIVVTMTITTTAE